MSNWYDPSEPSLLNMPTEASGEEKQQNEEKPVADEKTEQERWNEAVKAMDTYERLSHIQNEMKVPKNLFNKHGGYYYRNAETIMNTAKPICARYHCTLVVDDAVNQIGDRFYVSATALIIPWEKGGYKVGATAHARETAERKGMDSSQITGAASSYARKYALNGLFLLDDVKDADTDEYAEQSKEKPKQKVSDDDMADLVMDFNTARQDLKAVGGDIHNEKVAEMLCKMANIKTVDPGKLTADEMKRAIAAMGAMINAKKK